MSGAKSKTAKKQKLAKRIIRWLTYDTIFALLPLGMSVLLLFLADKLSIDALTKSPELLFFALMISVNSMKDMHELSAIIGQDIVFAIFNSALLLGAVSSAILYGILLYDNIIGLGLSSFREKLLWISIGLSLVMFILGTLAEFFIGRIEEK